MENIIIALITSATSIIVALIKARAETNNAFSQPRLNEKGTNPDVDKHDSATARGGALDDLGNTPSKNRSGKPDGVWWVTCCGTGLISLALASTDIVDDPAGWMSMVMIPATTLLLIMIKPIHWAYAATFVSVLQLCSFTGLFLAQDPASGESGIMSVVLVLNTVAWAALSGWRLKKKQGA